jgi:hypothetical protein
MLEAAAPCKWDRLPKIPLAEADAATLARHLLTSGQAVIGHNRKLVQVNTWPSAPLSARNAQPFQFGTDMGLDFIVGNAIRDLDQGDTVFTALSTFDFIAILQCHESLLVNPELLDLYEMLGTLIFERQLESRTVAVQFKRHAFLPQQP